MSFFPTFDFPMLFINLSLNVLSRQIFLLAFGPFGLEVPELSAFWYGGHWIAAAASEQVPDLLLWAALIILCSK